MLCIILDILLDATVHCALGQVFGQGREILLRGEHVYFATLSRNFLFHVCILSNTTGAAIFVDAALSCLLDFMIEVRDRLCESLGE
jgi:hypothetical protein